jgi:hypothetical protein
MVSRAAGAKGIVHTKPQRPVRSQDLVDDAKVREKRQRSIEGDTVHSLVRLGKSLENRHVRKGLSPFHQDLQHPSPQRRRPYSLLSEKRRGLELLRTPFSGSVLHIPILNVSPQRKTSKQKNGSSTFFYEDSQNSRSVAAL